jgi:hypothetical protein
MDSDWELVGLQGREVGQLVRIGPEAPIIP